MLFDLELCELDSWKHKLAFEVRPLGNVKNLLGDDIRSNIQSFLKRNRDRFHPANFLYTVSALLPWIGLECQ